MKKIILSIMALGSFSTVYAQTQAADSAGRNAPSFSSAGISDHKSSNSVLPRWAIDLKYRYCWLNQDISLINLKEAYGPNNQPTSFYREPKFENGSGMGADLRLAWFFNKERNLGVSIGAQYERYTGTLVLDSMYMDYQNVDAKNRVYRQMIHTNGPIKEDVTITNINVPVLLEFKHQFGSYKKASGGLGVWANSGPVIGLSSSSEGTASGKISYEAVYNTDGSNTFDGSSGPFYSGHSLVLTKGAYDLTHNTDGTDAAERYLDNERNGIERYNVGFNKGIRTAEQTKANSYNNVSFGGMLQAGLSYAVTYKAHFLLGGHIMYQQWQNRGNEKHQLTNTVSDAGGNYSGLTAAIKTSNYLSYGINAGFRIYFGEKRDVDGDKVADVLDHCPYEHGLITLNGCPDKDGDGVMNDDDRCPELPGDKALNGCPDSDGDGIADDRDACKDEFGELANGCPISTKHPAGDTLTGLPDGPGQFLPPHVVLKTDALLFAFNKAELNDSARRALDEAADTLAMYPKVIVYLSGNTDNIGTDDKNLVLSLQRANAAMNYLINKGIVKSRIKIGGWGKREPLLPNDTRENRAKNRRVDMMVLLPL